MRSLDFSPYRLLLLFLLLLLYGLEFTFSQENSPVVVPLFQSEDVLNISLSMDHRKVLNDVGDDPEQHPAELSYFSPEGELISLPLKIRTRGHFRKNPMNCNFPPLRLNFVKSEVVNTLFEGQDKLKLVTHCRSKGTQYEQNVLKEYLVYKLYNLFTDESYRVRLVEMSYADSRARRDTVYKMAFLLEPPEQMASRNNKNLIEIKNVQQEQCNPVKTTLLSVFQYMVGNTDWSVPVPHNIDLIQDKPGSVPIAVPFDFDWCGLVDAPYAVPAENLGISDVKIRSYRGLCREEEDYRAACQEFRDKKEKIFQTIDSVPLNEKESEKVRNYIEEFYSMLDNPNLIRLKFSNDCRTP